MKKKQAMLIGLATLALAVVSGTARGAEKVDEGKAKAAPAPKPAAKALCDDDWEGGFWTIAVDEKKYDGHPESLKNYDPQHPNEPWQALSERYLRTKNCCGDIFLHKFIGRFYEKKEAEVSLKKVYAKSEFARHLNPRYPPFVSAPGALLVSDKYTCTLNKENDTLTRASWIVEVDGRLFAGAETACKQGKKRTTVKVVDCAGSKTVVTDTLDAPCGVSVRSCLYPLPDAAFALDHVYTEGGEGTSVLVRAYDLKKKQRVFSAEETNDGGPETELMSVEDVDGDGVPEIVHRVAGTDELVSKLKWRNRRFVKVGR